MRRNIRAQKWFRPSPIPDRFDINRELNEEWQHLNSLIWQTVGCVAEKPLLPIPEDVNNKREDDTNGAEMNLNSGASTSSSMADLSYIWQDNSQSTQSTDLSFSSHNTPTEEYPSDFRRVYVSNIPFKYTALDLQRLCETVGAVTNAEVIYNERGSKGFGFVSYAHDLSAKYAIKSLNGLVIDGRRIEVHPATPKEKSAPKSKKKVEEEEAELQKKVLQKLQMIKFEDISR